MDYEKVKEWLDKLIDNKNEAISLEVFNDQISVAGISNYIQLYEGIDLIADIMGIELKMRERDCDTYPYEYLFIYRDIEFVQIEKELLYAGDD